ncbi:hypothetical protein LV779_21575 [Streptomyces thinghirensis]|nr:hypothetical protein [Streptomyces thinghirensis]
MVELTVTARARPARSAWPGWRAHGHAPGGRVQEVPCRRGGATWLPS